MKRIPPENLTIAHDIPPGTSHLPNPQITDKTPILALSVGSALLNLFSQHYQSQYKVGIVEWRIMAVLSNESNIRQRDICDALSADKAAVSRALTKLQVKCLIAGKDGEWPNRRKYWQLTPAGLALHDVMLDDSKTLNQMLLKGIPDQQVLITYHTLQQLQDNVQQYALSEE